MIAMRISLRSWTTAAILSVTVMIQSAGAQGIPKDVLIYIDRSSTVVDTSATANEGPSARLADMLDALLTFDENGERFIGPDDTISFATFAGKPPLKARKDGREDGPAFAPDTTLLGDQIDRLDAVLAKYRDPKANDFNGSRVTDFKVLLEQMTAALPNPDSIRPTLMLVASDFVPDPFNTPADVKAHLIDGDGALPELEAYFAEQAEALKIFATGVKARKNVHVALFTVRPDPKGDWTVNYRPLRDTIDKLPNGLLAQKEAALPEGSYTVRRYEEYAQGGAASLKDFIRTFISQIRGLYAGPEISVNDDDQIPQNGVWKLRATVATTQDQAFELIGATVHAGEEIVAQLNVEALISEEATRGLQQIAQGYRITGDIEMLRIRKAQAANQSLVLRVRWRWQQTLGQVEQARSLPDYRLERHFPDFAKIDGFEMIGLVRTPNGYTLDLKASGTEVETLSVTELRISGADGLDQIFTPRQDGLSHKVSLTEAEAERVLADEIFNVEPIDDTGLSSEAIPVGNTARPVTLEFPRAEARDSPNGGSLTVFITAQARNEEGRRFQRVAGFGLLRNGGCTPIEIEGGPLAVHPDLTEKRLALSIEIGDIVAARTLRNTARLIPLERMASTCEAGRGLLRGTVEFEIKADILRPRVLGWEPNLEQRNIKVFLARDSQSLNLGGFGLGELRESPIDIISRSPSCTEPSEGSYHGRPAHVIEACGPIPSAIIERWEDAGWGEIAALLPGEGRQASIGSAYFAGAGTSGHRVWLSAGERWYFPESIDDTGRGFQFIAPIEIRVKNPEKISGVRRNPVTFHFKIDGIAEPVDAIPHPKQNVYIEMRDAASGDYGFVQEFLASDGSIKNPGGGAPRRDIDLVVRPESPISHATWERADLVATIKGAEGDPLEIQKSYKVCGPQDECHQVWDFLRMSSFYGLWVVLLLCTILAAFCYNRRRFSWQTLHSLSFRKILEAMNGMNVVLALFGTSVFYALVDLSGHVSSFPHAYWPLACLLTILLTAFALYRSSDVGQITYQRYVARMKARSIRGLRWRDEFAQSRWISRRNMAGILVAVTAVLYLFTPRTIWHLKIVDLFPF